MCEEKSKEFQQQLSRVLKWNLCNVKFDTFDMKQILLQKIHNFFLPLSSLCEVLFEHMLQGLWTWLFCFVPSKCNILQWTFGGSFSSLGNDGFDLGFDPLDADADAWGWVEGGGCGGGGTPYLLGSLRTANLTWSLSSKLAPAHVILSSTQKSVRPSCI